MAVAEARTRQREKNKLAKLAGRGVGAAVEITDGAAIQSPAAHIQVAPDPLEEAFQEATRALVDVSNEQTIRNTTNENPRGVMTRRKQRQEEIRRMDHLAKEALERDD